MESVGLCPSLHKVVERKILASAEMSFCHRTLPWTPWQIWCINQVSDLGFKRFVFNTT